MCYLHFFLLDHSGGHKVLCGVHQDSAHRLRGVRPLSETALPSALQRPYQVGMNFDLVKINFEHDLLDRVSSNYFNVLRFSPLRPSRRQFPRVMPLSKPGQPWRFSAVMTVMFELIRVQSMTQVWLKNPCQRPCAPVGVDSSSVSLNDD